jgi:predicted helicase
MLNALAKDNTRNNIIAERMKECYGNNRHIIVLSDRISQLEELHNILVNYKHIPEEDIAYYIAKTTAKDRKLAEEKRIILSTYSMAKEGLDIPRLCAVVFATPKGDVVQASGRVQRKHPDKGVPLIIDIVDTFSIFEQLRWKRFAFYKAESFQCQTLNVQDPNAQWFQ